MKLLTVGDLEKKSKVFFWVTLFGAIIAIFIAVGALDARTEITIHPEMGCADDLKYNSDRYCPLWNVQKTKNWKLFMPHVGLHNRFLHVMMTPRKRKIENDELGPEQKVSTTLKVRVYNSIESQSPAMHWQEAVVFTCKQGVEACEPHVLKNIRSLDPDTKGVRIELELQDTHSLIMQLLFTSKTGNPAFTRELVILKFSVFLVSLIVLAWSRKNNSKVFASEANHGRLSSRTTQLLANTSTLALLQVCINDPLYYYVLTNPGPFSTTLTALCESGYYAYLLYYWLQNFQNLIEPEGDQQADNQQAQKWKKGLAWFMFLVMVIDYFLEFQLVHSPRPLTLIERRFPKLMNTAISCMIGFCGGYYLNRCWQASKVWSAVNSPNKILFLVSVYFAALVVVFLLDNLFKMDRSSGRKVLLNLFISNLHTVLMVGLLAPGGLLKPAESRIGDVAIAGLHPAVGGNHDLQPPRGEQSFEQTRTQDPDASVEI